MVIQCLFDYEKLCVDTEFFMVKMEFLIDQVRCGQKLNCIEVRLGDAAKNEGTEGAVIGFPNIIGLGVGSHTRVREHSL